MKLESQKYYLSFLRNFYIYRFFTDFAFIYAVYVILFKLRGLSVLEISLLLALWCVFVVIFEVPTGALADKWSRKYMLSLGILSKAIGFGIWYFAKDFWLFALGFFFWGIQETLCSGTQEALLFDTLKKYKKEGNYEKITGQGHFYSNIAAGISIFFGGFLASHSFDLTLILSIISTTIAIIPTFFFEEINGKRTSTEKVKYFSLLKNAFKACAKNKFLLRLILYSAIALAVIGILDEYEQLYFNWVNLPIALFGVITVLRMFLAAIGNKFAYRFQKRFKNPKNIYVLTLISGILLLLSIFYRSQVMLPFFALIFLFGGMGEVLVESGLQKEIKTDQRATIISINSLMLNLSAILLVTGFGILSRIGNLIWGFISFALLLILYSIISIIFVKNK